MRVGFVVVVHEIQAIALNGVGKRGVGGGNLIFAAHNGGLGRAAQLFGYFARDGAGDDVAGAQHRGQHVQRQGFGLDDSLFRQVLEFGVHRYFGDLGCNGLAHFLVLLINY